MQVFQTAGEPPSNGSMSLPNKGCKTNISEALTKSVPANKSIKERLRSGREGVLDMVNCRNYTVLRNEYRYCRGCKGDFQSPIYLTIPWIRRDKNITTIARYVTLA